MELNSRASEAQAKLTSELRFSQMISVKPLMVYLVTTSGPFACMFASSKHCCNRVSECESPVLQSSLAY